MTQKATNSWVSQRRGNGKKSWKGLLALCLHSELARRCGLTDPNRMTQDTQAFCPSSQPKCSASWYPTGPPHEGAPPVLCQGTPWKPLGRHELTSLASWSHKPWAS